MNVRLKDLYRAESIEIKKRMEKGDNVEISFENIEALSYSFIQDLKKWVHLANVKFVDVTDFVKAQLQEYLEVEIKEPEFDQMAFF